MAKEIEETEGLEPLEAETKEMKFRRVVNFRLEKALERLQMIEQMFDGANANNYDFTEEQITRLEIALDGAVERIIGEARRVLVKRSGQRRVAPLI